MKKKLQNFSLRVLLIGCSMLLLQQVTCQTILFTEDWETVATGQTPPAGWAIDPVSGANYIHFLQTGNFPSSYPFNGSRMVEFQSFYAASGTSNRLKCTTPVQTNSYAMISIDFEWFTSNGYPGCNDNVAVQWSTNGTTWSTAATIQRFSNTISWQYEVVPLPAGAINQPVLYIAFLFSSSYGDNCHLDLVHVTGYTTAPSPPAATTLAPTWIGSEYTYLAGIVNANGNTTNASFQYGLTTSYGSTTSAGTVTGNTATSINGYPYPLIPGHLYHCRAVATNVGGTTYGNDVTFSTLDTLPEVFTHQASDIGPATATLNGSVYPNGSTTTITFNYGLTASYGTTINANPATISGDSTETWARAVLTGLSPSTTYHFRITGVNAGGTSYGIDTILTTTGTLPPTVITTHATAISSTGATLNGNVNANATPANVTFQYGLTPVYGSTVTYGMVYGTTMTPVNMNINGLLPGTVYHFRAVGVNANGTSYGSDSVFTTTVILPPAVTTNPPPMTGATYSYVSGTFNANGNPTAVMFEYGLTASYDMTLQCGNISGNTPVTTEPYIYYLLPSHVYHYRAVGTNAGGTSYGSDVTFTTADTLPKVRTVHATNVGLSTATLNGLVYPNGSTTAITFNYGLTTSYGSTVTANPASISGDSLITWANAILTGLTPYTTYHYRIVGVNATGASYGLDTVFTTTVNLSPDVITMPASNVTSTLANLNGNVNPNGLETDVSFQYGLTSSYGSTYNYGHVYGNTMQPVERTISVLPQTLYHFRLKGSNSAGTSYGNDETFTTPAAGILPPTVITKTCYYYCATNAVLRGDANANGESTTITFQYGLTPAYGSTATYGTINGNNTDERALQVFNLMPSTLYHFRIVGSSAGGISYGDDSYFTTSDSTGSNNIYGQVFADAVPIQAGIVNLFSVDTIPPYLPYLATTLVDSAGTYHFDMVPQGDYYVNAIPVNLTGYLPTFYGDVLFWEDASIIHLGTPGNPYNIHLVGAATMYSGNGSITGQISTSGLKTNFVEKITMLLLNSNGTAIFYDPVKPGGHFSFASLAYGTYYLKAEMAGIASDLIKVVISGEKPDPSVILTYTGTNISGISDIASGITSWVAYPNPVNDQLTISLEIKKEMKVSVELRNLAGELLTTLEVVLQTGNNTISLSTASLPTGLYTLRLSSNAGMEIHTKLAKTR